MRQYQQKHNDVELAQSTTDAAIFSNQTTASTLAMLLSVPDGARYSSFTNVGDFAVEFGKSTLLSTTANFPSGNSTAGTAGKLNPLTKYLGSSNIIDTIKLSVASTLTKITTEFFNDG